MTGFWVRRLQGTPKAWPNNGVGFQSTLKGAKGGRNVCLSPSGKFIVETIALGKSLNRPDALGESKTRAGLSKSARDYMRLPRGALRQFVQDCSQGFSEIVAYREDTISANFGIEPVVVFYCAIVFHLET